MANRFQGHFNTSASTTQNGIELYKVKGTYICVTNVSADQISLRFALQPTLFELQAIWDNCTE